jgi:hypothetical protein
LRIGTDRTRLCSLSIPGHEALQPLKAEVYHDGIPGPSHIISAGSRQGNRSALAKEFEEYEQIQEILSINLLNYKKN